MTIMEQAAPSTDPRLSHDDPLLDGLLILCKQHDHIASRGSLSAGLPMPEEIITCDPLLRRFQYRITAPMFRNHLITIDVIDLEDCTTLAIYGVDAEPSVLALTIGGAAGAALEHLKDMLERGSDGPQDPVRHDGPTAL